MNELLARYVADSIEETFMDKGLMCQCEIMTQKEVKHEIKYLNENFFGMISHESTKDNPMDVDLDTSKFLNDSSYDFGWINVSIGDVVAYVCISSKNKNLTIEAIEVSSDKRGDGYGRIIVESIENFGYEFDIETISVSPFDSDAEEFWIHMGYEWSKNYSLIKKL